MLRLAREMGMSVTRLKQTMPASEVLEHMIDIAMRDGEPALVLLTKPKDV